MGLYFTASGAAVSCSSDVKSFHLLNFTSEGRTRKMSENKERELLLSRLSPAAAVPFYAG